MNNQLLHHDKSMNAACGVFWRDCREGAIQAAKSAITARRKCFGREGGIKI
jgi:hypothetical protein